MISLKRILEKHFLGFIQNNELDNLKEKMIEAIVKAEYEVHDLIHEEIEHEATDLCHDYEIQIKSLKADLYDLIKKNKQDDFFVPKTIQDEFKIQWIKDNWDNIPSI
jgi:hypothetical protein